jgi:hypothetical protein
LWLLFDNVGDQVVYQRDVLVALGLRELDERSEPHACTHRRRALVELVAKYDSCKSLCLYLLASLIIILSRAFVGSAQTEEIDALGLDALGLELLGTLRPP